MLKKAVMLVSGNALGSALNLVRNLVVARILSPEDYGIAATFAITMSLVEMLSYLGLNQLIVVDRDGDDPDMQRALQGFQLLRGLFSAAVLFLIARPYAAFLGVQDIAWAYQVMAVIPLVNGLQHYDMHRLRRHMQFRPAVIVQSLAPLVALLSVWPLALIWSDFRIMLGALIVQACAMVGLSHLTARRGYGLRWDLAVMRRATMFGWPLLLNGMLLFVVFNGERLIVGRELGMAQLAVFSMAITLTLTPTLVLAGACQSLFLPALSAARERPDSFRWLGIASIEAGLAIGVLLLLGVALIGGPLVHLLLGGKYDAILPILLPIAVVQVIRVAKSGSATVALSVQRSGNAALSNAFRAVSVPISWVALVQTGSLMAVIHIAMAAELVGYLAALVLAARRAGLGLSAILLPSGMVFLTLSAALVLNVAYPPRQSLPDHLATPAPWVLAMLAVLSLATMSHLRRYMTGKLRALWARRGRDG